jgi:CHAT domain-containing protein
MSNIHRFFRKQRWLIFLALALLGLLIGVHSAIAVQPAPLLQQAEQRYQSGQIPEAIALWQEASILYESQGKTSETLEIWQRSELAYRKLRNNNGALGSQINQARALQAAGFYKRATELLTQVEQSLQQQPDSSTKVTGLRHLGKMLRLVGNLPKSRSVLEQSLAIALKLPNENTSGILLSLGNTVRVQGDVDTAIAYYQRGITSARSLIEKIQIQIAQLNVLIDLDQLSEAASLFSQIQPQLATLPSDHLSIYARINLARSAVRMSDRTILKTSAQDVATAVQQARTLGDRRAESYALGTLGSLYEKTQQWETAKKLTQDGLAIAQSMNAIDIAYQWQWQLGRVLCQNTSSCVSAENLQASIVAYGEAVNMLRSLRSDLAAINQDVQFSFRESVEPVYRQFVERLLQSNNATPSQSNLSQAREVIEALQLAELDNFFREACLDASPVKVDQIDAQAAVIYPIILPNQLAVILSLPNQPLRYYKTQLPQAKVETLLTQLRQALGPTAFVEDWLPLSQQVYNLLLRPAQAELAASGAKTLVFVPDGLLRNLPMAALHDGQKYLIEQYSIVFNPGLQLLQPQPLTRVQLNGLLAGLTQARDRFLALPNVAIEIDQIKSEIPAQVLLDQTFTKQELQNRVNSTNSPIVHLATHGQFSSNAESTFILTWDGRMNVKEMDQLLRSREGNLRPIELLVLSACQTATGDKRAALGMAGFAVRSGARSTIASLWSVSDRSTASLMIEFYRELGKSGVTRAEALRRAQLTLLRQEDYTSPYYWAPFVLLGNWL